MPLRFIGGGAKDKNVMIKNVIIKDVIRKVIIGSLFLIFFLLFFPLFSDKAYAVPLTGGNPAVDRLHLDSSTDFTLVDTNNPINVPITGNGRVESWSVYAERQKEVYLKIFRQVDPTTFVVIGQSRIVTPSVGTANTFVLDVPILVKTGDLVGLHFKGNSAVSFDKDPADPFARGDLDGKVKFTNSGENPGIGEIAGFDNSSDRLYSVKVEGMVEFKVDDDGNDCEEAVYTTIQDALAAAPAGEIIDVCRGTYQGPIDIERTGMTVRSTSGSSVTTIEASPATNGIEYGFRLKNNEISVRGFTIQNANNQKGAVGALIGAEEVGILNPAIFGDRATITGNVFLDNNYAIFAWKSSNNKIRGNVIRNGHLIAGSGAAVAIWDGDDAAQTSTSPHANNNEVSGNVLDNNGTVGILVGSSSTTLSVDNKINSNTITSSGVSQAQIELTGVSKTTVASNNLKNSGGVGIKLSSADNNTVKYNKVTEGKGTGILLGVGDDPSGSDSNTLTSNIITRVGVGGADDGIRLGAKAEMNVLESNIISEVTRDGIRAVASAKNNTLEKNIMRRNLVFDAHDLTSPLANIWRRNICRLSSPVRLCR